MDSEISKTYLVSIENEESIPYIKNHLRPAFAQILNVKGANYDLRLTYKQEDEQIVNGKFIELKSSGII